MALVEMRKAMLFRVDTSGGCQCVVVLAANWLAYLLASWSYIKDSRSVSLLLVVSSMAVLFLARNLSLFLAQLRS